MRPSADSSGLALSFICAYELHISRVDMCRLACDQMSSWLMVDDWEASQPEYQRTAVVLEHLNKQINQVYGGAIDEKGASEFRLLSVS